MKIFVSVMTVLLMAISSVSASNEPQPLDGLKFNVSTWKTHLAGLETPESLEFHNGNVDAPVCHLYGFFAAPYKAVEKDGRIYFCFTNVSDTEGELQFTGVVTDGQIRGTYVWKKEGRADLQYAFEGSLN